MNDNSPSILSDSGITDILIDLGEDYFDSLTESDVLKEIPVIKSLIAVAKLGSGIRDKILQRKIVDFIKSVHDKNIKIDPNFKTKFESNAEFKQKVNQQVILILERIDDLEKIPLLTKAFGALLSGQIEFDDYRRLSSAIDRCYLPDLKYLTLEGVSSRGQIDRRVIESLFNSGLLEVTSLPAIRAPEAQNEYSTSEFGKFFYSTLLC